MERHLLLQLSFSLSLSLSRSHAQQPTNSMIPLERTLFSSALSLATALSATMGINIIVIIVIVVIVANRSIEMPMRYETRLAKP